MLIVHDLPLGPSWGCGSEHLTRMRGEPGRGHVREQFVRTNCHSRARSRRNVWAVKEKCMGKTVFFGAELHWGASGKIW